MQNAKKFSLKPNERQMVLTMQQQYTQSLFNFFSFIAVERMAYNVTGKTQFQLNEDGTELSIFEAENGQQIEPAGDTGATGKALKK